MVVFLLVHVKINKAREEVSIVSTEEVKWIRSRAHVVYDRRTHCAQASEDMNWVVD